MADLSGFDADSPPLLPHDDLLREILLRLPPEPIYLLRALLVSKHWRSLIHDARFLRRFRAFHGAPPVLGFLNSQPGPPLFVPTSNTFAVPSTMTTDSWWPLDCRHGFALLKSSSSWDLVVWDPMSGEKRCLPPLPHAFDDADRFNGAVLQAAGNDDDDRIGWRSCPFLVAMALTHNKLELASVYVYSSETGGWGDATSVATIQEIQTYPTALVGSTLLYWQMTGYCILELDLEKHSLDIIEVPHEVFDDHNFVILIMPAEDGGIGFAGVGDIDLTLSLNLFSWVPSTLEWTLRRTIDLEEFLGSDVVMMPYTYRSARYVQPVGFDEDADVIFLFVDSCVNCVYMLHLKSMRIEEVWQRGNYSWIHPYSSFYTATLPCP